MARTKIDLATQTQGNLPIAELPVASANSKLVGSGAAGSGAAYTEIALGTNLSMTGTTLNAAGGSGSPGGSPGQVQYNNAGSFGGFTTSGDATINTATGALTIAAAAVTLAKIANAAANSKLLGSGAAGSGASYSELTLGTGLSMSGTTLNATGAYPTPTTVTPSAVSSVAITSCIISAYRDYEIRISDVIVSAAGQSLFAQVSTDNGVTWDTSSSYQYNGHYTAIDFGGADGNLGAGSGGGTSWFVLPLGSVNTTTPSNSARYTLFNPLGAVRYKQMIGQVQQTQNSDSHTYIMSVGFRYLNANAINAIKFFVTSGTFSGTITMQPLPL